jgi:release factor glutamine methyltransferase
MHSVLEIIKKTTDFFAAKGVENPRHDAEVIIGHALGLKRMALYVQFERFLTEPELEKIRPLIKRRAQREPLSYVVGNTEFASVQLKTDRRALIPRPETEELVEHVLAECQLEADDLRLLDLGTGTGCIALSLAASLPEASVTAVDSSEEALALAKENAALNKLEARVRLLRSDWYAALGAEEPFDVIVSNPPYLTEQETAETQPEVREHEPFRALAAADSGMADLRRIITGAPRFLKPGGLLALETGIAQHGELLTLLQQAGFPEPRSLRDLSGRDRFLLARLKN